MKQATPPGIPSILVPSADKQDVDQLQVDIHKWKLWISEQSWEEWSHFLDLGVQKLQQIPSVCPDWPLQTLLNGATDETEETENHHASDQATILLEKERQGCEV